MRLSFCIGKCLIHEATSGVGSSCKPMSSARLLLLLCFLFVLSFVVLRFSGVSLSVSHVTVCKTRGTYQDGIGVYISALQAEMMDSNVGETLSSRV
ncbi:hypothetical protein CEXT_509041 [Caerostris extrusa]|uniref:Uncharacterized protein n=1 Tax=Caerostris extrusa TaxID=172846 RepID=A0AAV4X4I7_CAEEX|nr:hypothetical protein CEXT_509041 [Caerostris extrusa]